jgi:hypothetical protein
MGMSEDARLYPMVTHRAFGACFVPNRDNVCLSEKEIGKKKNI